MSLPAIAKPADTRNLEWKSANVGAKLLAKMGWTDGEAVGKRQRAEGQSVSGEGLRVAKRLDGLGIGAKHLLSGNDKNHPVHHFSALLTELNKEHGGGTSEDDKRKKKKKSKKNRAPVLPTNKTTHHKVRAAKFQEKTAEDFKCIFGGHDFPVVAPVESGKSKKRKRSEEESKKKKRKKDKKDK